MAKVILHIGDKVTHKTLGEGHVTIVDDGFVTIKFATDELTFRLPDAFQKGFLTSDAAVITGNMYEDNEDNEDDDEEEDEDGEEDKEEDEDKNDEDDVDFEFKPLRVETAKPTVAPPAEKKKLKFWDVMLAIVLPCVYVVPVEAILWFFYYITESTTIMIFAIIGAVFLLSLIIYCFHLMKKPESGYGMHISPMQTNDSNKSSIVQTLFIGTLLGRHIARHEHKSLFESSQDDLFWQEKYRKDHHYDDEDW